MTLELGERRSLMPILQPNLGKEDSNSKSYWPKHTSFLKTLGGNSLNIK
jgi:hypothetical protein